ncbi:hypothetical protein TruAng_000880 [Truncatella angustata]|nr:hypothetical protein TruAng_000880 [Truncatella angustata]
MCHLQKLDCYMCKLKLMKAGKYECVEDTNSTTKYILQPCDNLNQRLEDWKEESQQGTFDYDNRWHCPELQWPSDPNAPTRWICEDCLFRGYQEFQHNRKDPKMKQIFKHDSYGRHVRSPSNSSGDEEAPTSRQFLPDTYQWALKESMQEQMVDVFEDDYDIAARSITGIQIDKDSYWAQRVMDAEHRILTLFVPLCKVCHMPTVMPPKTTGDGEDVWLADVECHANRTFWKWLFTRAYKGPFQVQIRTAKLVKPCHSCIKNETNVRREVYNALEKYGNLNWIRWMIFSWLTARGVGNTPFFDHAAMNMGFPNTDPPTLEEMLGLMADGWKRVTWVSWTGVFDLDPADITVAGSNANHSDTRLLPITIDQKPLVSLAQWPEHQPGTPLEVQHAIPSLNLQISSLVNGGDLDREVLIRGTKRRADGTPKSSIWEQSSYLLTQLGGDPAIMASLKRQSGLSALEIYKVFKAGTSILENSGQTSTCGRKKAKHVIGRHVTTRGALHEKTTGKPCLQQISESAGERPSPNDKDKQRAADKHSYDPFDLGDISLNGSDDLFGVGLVGDNATEGDINLSSSQFEIPDLEDGENAVAQCDMGHFHLIEAGKIRSAPGELFGLPIGLKHMPATCDDGLGKSPVKYDESDTSDGLYDEQYKSPEVTPKFFVIDDDPDMSDALYK